MEVAAIHYRRDIVVQVDELVAPGSLLSVVRRTKRDMMDDATPDQLGTKLMLPPWMETWRAELEKALPKLRLPEWHGRASLA